MIKMVDNKQVMCANCGTPMQQTFTRTGLKLYVCLHNSAKMVKTRVGRPKHALVYCTTKVFGLKKAFDNMTADTNLTIQKLRNATKNRIDDANLYKSTNLALELKFDSNILPELFEAATILGYSLGINAQKSIESLVIGIARKSRLVLDNIGVVFLAQDAYKWYCSEYGIDKQPNWTLNEEERDKAWKQYAIKTVIETANRIKNPTDHTHTISKDENPQPPTITKINIKEDHGTIAAMNKPERCPCCGTPNGNVDDFVKKLEKMQRLHTARKISEPREVFYAGFNEALARILGLLREKKSKQLITSKIQ